MWLLQLHEDPQACTMCHLLNLWSDQSRAVVIDNGLISPKGQPVCWSDPVSWFTCLGMLVSVGYGGPKAHLQISQQEGWQEWHVGLSQVVLGWQREPNRISGFKGMNEVC